MKRVQVRILDLNLALDLIFVQVQGLKHERHYGAQSQNPKTSASRG